jgi:two-component system sensor histidine kinase RegB
MNALQPSPSPSPLALTAPKLNLHRLLLIRWLLLLGLVFGIFIANQVFAVDLPNTTLGIVLSIAIAFNLGTHFRLSRSWPLTHLEFAAQILMDIIGISFIFYFSGGATNPFVSYYLVPLIISAATLPWVYTGIFALLSLGAYSLLLFYYVPIAALEPTLGEHAQHGGKFHPHIIGMWFNFLLSAGLITFFIVRMSSALREQERELNARNQDSLRDEQVLAVATLAAGTAHELGSPLTTMKVLVSEIEHENADNANLKKDLQTLKQQINLCSATLKQLTARADVSDLQQASEKVVKDYFQSVIERWLIIRPEVKADTTYQGDTDIKAHFHPTLDQAIINLLNNAADASPEAINIEIVWSLSKATITINDRGAGIPDSVRQQLGQAFVTTKGKGMGLGLGLFLSNATISRSGGTIKLFDRDGGGTSTIIELPLQVA